MNTKKPLAKVTIARLKQQIAEKDREIEMLRGKLHDLLHDEDGMVSEIKDSVKERGGGLLNWRADDFFSDIEADREIEELLSSGIRKLEEEIISSLLRSHEVYRAGIERAKEEMEDAI